MSTQKFDISPEKHASYLHFFYRQIFVTPTPVQAGDVDLKGKTAIVTGSNTGIGLETSRQLLDLGLSKLILAVRDTTKGEAARKSLLQSRPDESCIVEVWPLDLNSYESITLIADRAKSLGRMDIAIMNAGIFKLTEDMHPDTGFEMDIQINYLSTTLLAILLLPALKNSSSSDPARLVFVSSDVASWPAFTERSSSQLLNSFRERMLKWDYFERYGTSKLLMQLFLTQLAKHVPASIVIANAANPGYCYGSGLGREVNGFFKESIFHAVSRCVGRPCHVGARSIVHAAVSWNEEVHGQLVEDSGICP
jgi:NAD(P)-dependent dehydrogenase (short-subunit alcohol dehydrogenase family)